MQSDWLAIFPLVILAGAGSSVLCLGAFWRKRPSWLLFATALAALLAAGATASLFSIPNTATFSGMVDTGAYGRFFAVLFCAITAMVLLFAHQYATTRGFAGDEFYGLILFAALGMLLVASAVHWLIFLLGLEMLSLSLYVLIAIRKGSTASHEAGLKYLVMGAVASAFLIFGIALFYAVSGTLAMGRSLELEPGTPSMPGVLLAASLVLVGIGFKISLVPFHVWTPDVYQGAPAPITAFLSTGSKIAIFSALLRLALLVPDTLWTYLVPVVWILAALTMVVGNVAALGQTSVKRLLAYSSVAHMGYLLMALLAIRDNGAPAVMFYLVVYAVMDLGAFGIVGTLSPGRSDLDVLDDYKGLGYVHPWRSALLALCLISLAGLPPTAGFIGKFMLFEVTLKAGFIALALVGIATVILSIYVYLKVIVSLYMRPSEMQVSIPDSGIASRVAAAVLLFLVIGLGLFPSPLLSLITRILYSFNVAPWVSKNTLC